MRDIIDLVESTGSTFYHVTFQTRAPAVEKQGLMAGRKSNWKNVFGSDQGDRSLIYLFGDATSAVRWAANMEWEFEKPTVIIEVNNPPGLIRRDDHIQMQLSGYSAVVTDENVPPSCIGRIVPLTAELRRSVVNGGQAALAESALLEKLFYRVELKNDTVSVLENPFRRELLGNAVNDWWRGFLTDDGTVYCWDAFYATHYDIGSKLGIKGKRFEIRGSKMSGPVTMLYLPRELATSADECAGWRANRRICRIFGNDTFHIGALRV